MRRTGLTSPVSSGCHRRPGATSTRQAPAACPARRSASPQGAPAGSTGGIARRFFTPPPPRPQVTLPPARDGVRLLTVRVDVDEVEPAVWRRFEVRSDGTMAQFHDVLQAALGWADAHLHRFTLDRRRTSGAGRTWRVSGTSRRATTSTKRRASRPRSCSIRCCALPAIACSACMTSVTTGCTRSSSRGRRARGERCT